MRQSVKRKARSRTLLSPQPFPRLTPKIVVGATAALIASVILFGGDLRRAFVGSYNPRIAFARGEENRDSRAHHHQQRQAQNAPVFDGEVYRTERRLREASAVTIAASLAGVARAMEHRPAQSIEELLVEIARRNLLPPGVEFSPDRRSLVSERSTIHIRFRPEPFGIEVLSLGREHMDGAGLLVRVPDEADNQQATQRLKGNSRQRYFHSFRLQNITVPEAFAEATAVQAAGWQADYFDAQLPDGTNAEQLAGWTREHGGQSR